MIFGRAHILLFGSVLATLLTACDNRTTRFGRNDRNGIHALTEWNGRLVTPEADELVIEHPDDQPLRGPPFEAFVDGAPLGPLVCRQPVVRQSSDGSPYNASVVFCPLPHLEPNREYVVIHRRSNGTGGSYADAALFTTFEGEPALVMRVQNQCR